MALNINTITPAVEKAKNIATEQYVDSSIASIDVSSDINANNDVFAQKLGYANYQAMVSAASSGQTIINGGYVNTSLLQAGSIVSSKIASYNITAENTTFGSSIIGNAQIVDGSITNGKIVNASIDNAKIADASITNAKIGDLSVSTFKIQDEAVMITRYASGSGECSIIYTPAVSHGVVLNVSSIGSFVGDYSTRTTKINSVTIASGYSMGSPNYANVHYSYLTAGVTYTFKVEAYATSYYGGDGTPGVQPLSCTLVLQGAKK